LKLSKNEFWRKREKRVDFLQIRFCECETGLLDAFDFTKKRFSERTFFYFNELYVRAA